MTEPAKKRGRPPLFGRAMTGLERQHRYLAARSKRLREAAPDQFPNAMTAEQMFAVLGPIPTISGEMLAAMRALPGGNDPADFDPYAEDDDGQPHPVDEFGEPLDSPNSTLPAGGPYSGR